MPPTKRCNECGQVMYGRDDKYEPQGTWVTYICRNGACPSAKRGYPNQIKEFVRK
jgi:hypothetical protein